MTEMPCWSGLGIFLPHKWHLQLCFFHMLIVFARQILSQGVVLIAPSFHDLNSS